MTPSGRGHRGRGPSCPGRKIPRQPSTIACRARLSTAFTTAAAVSSSVPIYARSLQRLRQRSFELFELPAVYCPVAVSIPRRRRENRIALIGVPVISRRRRLRRGGDRRVRLRPGGADEDGCRDGQCEVHQYMLHPGALPTADPDARQREHSVQRVPALDTPPSSWYSPTSSPRSPPSCHARTEGSRLSPGIRRFCPTSIAIGCELCIFHRRLVAVPGIPTTPQNSLPCNSAVSRAAMRKVAPISMRGMRGRFPWNSSANVMIWSFGTFSNGVS
jgi:hypothetical protein